MKLSALREQIEDYSAEDLRFLVAELYRCLPSSIRVQRGVDDLLRNPKSAQPTELPPNAQPIEISDAIQNFLEQARAGYYQQPNAVIPERERRNWRFQVNRWFKALSRLSDESKQRRLQKSLLEALYILLCEGIGIFYFSENTPFRSCHIPQPDFWKQLLLLKWETETPESFIQSSFDLLHRCEVALDTGIAPLLRHWLDSLSTPALREMALNTTEAYFESKALEWAPQHEDFWSRTAPKKLRSYNYMVQAAFELHLDLFQAQEAIAVFLKYYLHPSKVSIYNKLIQLLFYRRRKAEVEELLKQAEQRFSPLPIALKQLRKSLQKNDQLPEVWPLKSKT